MIKGVKDIKEWERKTVTNCQNKSVKWEKKVIVAERKDSKKQADEKKTSWQRDGATESKST